MKVYDIVVPVSGGKDSQACLQLAVENHDKDKVLGLFCDTQFEHPLTYKHVEHMSEMYGVDIVTVSDGSVPEIVRSFGRFPGGGARHCTEYLKLVPSKKFYISLADKQNKGFEVWCGMRAEESKERAKRYAGKVGEDTYPPHEVLSKYPKSLYEKGVTFRLPIIEWSENDVYSYVGLDNLNPLYKAGFTRVGCFPCLASGDSHKEKSFKHDETGRKHFQIALELSKDINYPLFTSKGGRQRNKNLYSNDNNPGCSFCSI